MQYLPLETCNVSSTPIEIITKNVGPPLTEILPESCGVMRDDDDPNHGNLFRMLMGLTYLRLLSMGQVIIYVLHK